MGTLSAPLSPWQEQPRCRPAPPTAVLDSAAFNSAAVSVTSDVDVNNLMLMSMSTMTWTMIRPLMPPPPPPIEVPPPSLSTTRKHCCGVHRSPSQICHNGCSCGQIAPPTHQVGNAPIIHMAGAGKVLI